VNGPFAALLFAVAYGWGLLLSVFALLLHQLIASRPFPSRDLPRMLACAVLENMGYRQLTVAWRLRGMWKYARGRRDWGVMTRRGFGTTS
jgi:hypothetical protein